MGAFMKIYLVATAAALMMAACGRGEAIRTSANTMQIQASAAPICGTAGAARLAATTAAIETIQAGYDAYIISGGAARSNTAVVQEPGTMQTSGTLTYGRGFGTYNG